MAPHLGAGARLMQQPRRGSSQLPSGAPPQIPEAVHRRLQCASSSGATFAGPAAGDAREIGHELESNTDECCRTKCVWTVLCMRVR